jgi:hypothetical protein
MFEWLTGPSAATKARLKAEAEEKLKPKHITVADLISQLLLLDPEAQMGVTNENFSILIDNNWNRKGVALKTANKIDSLEIRPTRLLVEGEPGFVAGLKNVTVDTSVKPTIWFRLTSEHDADPLTVGDLLRELYETDPECVLAHQGKKPHATPGTNIVLKEIHPLRDLIEGEPGYLRGAKNQTYAAHKFASLFINGRDWARFPDY